MNTLRNYLHRTGFRSQLTILVSAAILCLAVVSSLVSALEASRRVRAQLVESGQQVTSSLARQSALALVTQAPENAQEAVTAALEFPDVVLVEIYTSQGEKLLERSRANQPSTPPGALPKPGAALPGDGAALVQDGEKAWVFESPVKAGPTHASPFEMEPEAPQTLGHVRVVIEKVTLHRLVRYLLLSNLLIALSIAAVLVLLLNVLTKRLTRPLSQLSEHMRRAESGESGLRAQLQGPPDITHMAKAFNQMMTVLEEREAELKRSRDEAIKVSLLKAQFAATVSHEVRTPLNGVVGMLDMLKTLPMEAQQREYVQEAWSSARSLTSLINDILDFSRMDAGKVELEAIDFSLRQVVEEVMTMLALSARSKSLALGYVMTEGVPERIKGDPTRLRQVLVNLLGNAVKFTDQGEVALRVHRGDDTAIAPGSVRLLFEVSDTGIGMNAAALENVFESFTQADRSTTRKYGGTGLGLAICKQLVELMQGQISVRSEVGLGSTFSFHVQCYAADAAEEIQRQPHLNGQRVLVVQPSEVVRQFVQATVLADGGRCTSVLEGTQALAAMQEALGQADPYRLVVMEVGACDDHGADLSARIRAEEAYSAVRLLMLAQGASNSREGGLGADAYLDQPLRRERLLQALRRHLAPEQTPTTAPEAAPPAEPLPAVLGTRTFQVLVAEDNRTNRAVAAGMLKMLNCVCHFAVNGLEAVQAVQTKQFDVILMDCSMPELDGYEATARIRALEKSAGSRTPIIAMTANTQKGDAEKCLAAGMDDYLSKPITLVEVRSKLEKWLSMGCGSPESAQTGLSTEASIPVPSGATPGDAVALNMESFGKLKEVLGDSLTEAIEPFLEDFPASMEQLQQALDRGDVGSVRAVTHTVKGSSGNIGAVAIAGLAKQANELAHAGRLGDIHALLPQMRSAFDEAAALLRKEIFDSTFGDVEIKERSGLVLVVDDDRSTRTALRLTLQRDGFHVEEAANGELALSMLDQIEPDVILLDAVMPVLDGFATCTQIKSREKAKNIPVLIITALEDNTSVERAFAVGASDYIPKPIHFTVLSQRVRSIVDATRAERHIRRLAYNDTLTGLPNRAMFIDQLGQQLVQAHDSAESVAVLFMDLNRFKAVNDTLGHEVGDKLLKGVADRIRRVVRGLDLVARLGGDEFTVALSPADANAAGAVAQNICRALARPFSITGHEIFISASIGIALFKQNGEDVHTLLKHADMAMYRAKKDNSDFQFFDASMENALSGQLRLETELRRALEREEFEVFYQPKAQVESGRVVGMEALVRWRHPVRGLVPPNDFIPVTEQTGLIIPLGEWVMRASCAQAKKWHTATGQALHVAVNISAKQLLQKGFVATVEKALQDTGLQPDLLELEITESTLMEFAKDTLDLLGHLRDLGVRLSIDDFGTGYSSLAYLKRFPINTIKIDRTFIRDIPKDADDMAITSVIITLAHSLRLAVVAEGVETQAQRDFLQAHDCNLMQGYLLSPPVPADVFEKKFLSLAAPAVAAESPIKPSNATEKPPEEALLALNKSP
jgi:diguanylate cyclase (GGDEF)-like protein